tara:strand:+ start:105 stop:749 length:645 start_codon:yes stop_codon:yes gene_type:complete
MATQHNTQYQTPIETLSNEDLAIVEGQKAIVFNSTNNRYEGFNGSEWSALSEGAIGQGFVDYNDASTAQTPLTLTPDTWTDVPNDKAGAFTNEVYAPQGVTSLMDGTTGYLDFSQLTLGSDVMIRIDFSVTPNTNNALLETRYVLGQGAGEYPLHVRSRRLDSGSGIPYASEKGSFYIYMGDENTLGGVGKLQIKLSTTGTLMNNGVAIKIYKK